jgi:hypothetical protein
VRGAGGMSADRVGPGSGRVGAGGAGCVCSGGRAGAGWGGAGRGCRAGQEAHAEHDEPGGDEREGKAPAGPEVHRDGPPLVAADLEEALHYLGEGEGGL